MAGKATTFKRHPNYKIEFPGDESDKIVTQESMRAVKTYLKSKEKLPAVNNTEVLRAVFKFYIDSKVRPYNVSLTEQETVSEDYGDEIEDTPSEEDPLMQMSSGMQSQQQSSGKKLINGVDSCVDDCLKGLVAVNTGMQILSGHKVVIRSDVEELKRAGKVAVLSGGGSGHEPAHGGYVGAGMLTGAIAGAVFTSPPVSSILAAIRKVGKDNAGGVLLVIKNYTGDRLNFGMAAERAKAEGILVDMVVVGEDCALTSSDKSAGRRGLCGTVFIHKIAGSLSEAGHPLIYIVSICSQAVASMGTIGLSLSPCSVPGSGPSFQLAQDEMELGLGIHGEAGVKRLKVLPAREAVTVMLDHMTNPQSATQLPLPKGSVVAVMINNLGGTSVLELNIVAEAAISLLESRGVLVHRAYCGSFMTALEMAGVSITVMLLNEQLKQCLDQATIAPGWSPPMFKKGQTDRVTQGEMECEMETKETTMIEGVKISPEIAEKIRSAVVHACDMLSKNELQLNQLDSQTGDADCGTTIKRGVEAITKKIATMPVDEPNKLMLVLSSIAETAMGGSSGAFYSLMFTAAARALTLDVSPQAWCQALGNAVEAVSHYGGAEPGDRTMLDPLHAAHTKLSELINQGNNEAALEAAQKAAEESAQSTASMKARAGRASYVSQDHQTQPDPGAVAVSIWMRALYDSLC